MRIGFVIKALSLPGGGAERVLSELSTELARRGHEVLIATFDEPDAKPFYSFPVSICCLGSAKHPTKMAEFLWHVSAIRQWAKTSRPDVVLAFMHSSYVPASIALKGICRVIASEHIGREYYRSRPIEGVAALLGRLLSVETVAPIGGIGETIPNPVSPAEGKADPVGGDRKCILSIGRITPQKNHELLIKSFYEVAADFPDWYVRIVGDGSLRSSMKRLVVDLGLAGRVFMPSSNPDVRGEYLNAQIFALPSLYESFGLVTAEALSYGLPVIGLASCRGTNSLVVDGKNGILTSPRDFASRLRALMAHGELRSTLGSGLNNPEIYSIAAVTDKWDNVICRLFPCDGALRARA